MALTLAEQRELPGEEVSRSVEFLVTSPYGSRRYALKVSAIGLYASGTATDKSRWKQA